MDMVALAEAAEGNLMLGLLGSSERVLERMGLAGRRIGGGIALSASKDTSGFWSKAQGFGFSEPLTGEVLAEVIDFYRSEGTASANFHLPERVLPADWAELAAKYELTPRGTLVKLQRGNSPVAPAPTTLRVGPISEDDRTAWAAVQIEAFEFEDADGRMADMLASVGQIENVTAYGAWDGDLLVATGALYVDGQAGELVSGATRPEYRGRGAQSALVARRTQDALAAGCDWVFSETGKPGPGEQNPSLDNLQRAGFQVIYDRPIWAWKV